jgi:hypothetical protein
VKFSRIAQDLIETKLRSRNVAAHFINILLLRRSVLLVLLRYSFKAMINSLLLAADIPKSCAYLRHAMNREKSFRKNEL